MEKSSHGGEEELAQREVTARCETSSSVLFRLDELRRRIEDHFSRTTSRELILRLLHEALSSTIIFMVAYQRQYYLWPQEMSAPLYQMSKEKFELADSIGARITQLGGRPDYSEERMLSSCSPYLSAKRGDPSLLCKSLAAEKDSAELWASVLDRVGNSDTYSRDVIQNARDFARRHAITLEALIKLPEADRPGDLGMGRAIRS